MERSVAVKKLARILGKNMGYRVDPSAPDADERAAAHVANQEVMERRKKLDTAILARKQRLLDDPEYKALCEEHREVDKEVKRLLGMQHHYRFTVGTTTSGPFRMFMIKAQGDSWEQVIEQIEKQKKN